MAHLASDLEAVFAMTVLAKFDIAVISSSSVSVVGGLSLKSVSLNRVKGQDGICNFP
jgi:hypothetical protein